MTDNEKLIEEAREFIVGGRGPYTAIIRELADALEAAEKAHTPTDDEREALAQALRDSQPKWSTVVVYEKAVDAVLAAGFRRSEAPHD